MTFPPLPPCPDRNVPRFSRRIALSTLLLAASPYFRLDPFRAGIAPSLSFQTRSDATTLVARARQFYTGITGDFRFMRGMKVRLRYGAAPMRTSIPNLSYKSSGSAGACSRLLQGEACLAAHSHATPRKGRRPLKRNVHPWQGKIHNRLI